MPMSVVKSQTRRSLAELRDLLARERLTLFA
jgi:hypothetical protein